MFNLWLSIPFTLIYFFLPCLWLLMLKTVNINNARILDISYILIPLFDYTVTLCAGYMKWLSTIIEIALDTSTMIFWINFANWAGKLEILFIKFVFIYNFGCIHKVFLFIFFFFEPYFLKIVDTGKVIPVSTINLHYSSF